MTGGAGFVGSHLVDRLVEEGEHVVILDNLSTGRLANLERSVSSGNATYVYADVASSAEVLRDAVASATDEPLTQIYHLASPASPVAYGAHPWATLAVNAIGTMSLIELALEQRARMLFASTSEIYGDPLVHPQPETYFGNVNPIGPRACYDEGKRFGEAAMSVAIRERGLDGRIVRIFNCYGPRMDLEDGRLIPALLAAIRDRRPMPVHGTGEQTRSMTYVDDLIEGIRIVADAPFRDTRPINLGSEEEYRVVEIARELAAVAGISLVLEALDARPEDPQRRRPDLTNARELGWSPMTTLREGLTQTYAWFIRDALQYA